MDYSEPPQGNEERETNNLPEQGGLPNADPELDEEFLIRYKLSYGLNSSDAQAQSSSTPPQNHIPQNVNTPAAAAPDPANPIPPSGDKSLKRKAPNPAQWFELDDAQNTKVYVSNLPLDITEEEFMEFMSKCGIIMKDTSTGDAKMKLYTDSDGNKKGDGLCTYIKIESVHLALQILDGSDLRGHKVSVERAQFQLKGAYDPTKKPKSKKRKDKEKVKKMQEKLFEWKPEKMRGERSKHERIVVVQNAFSPADFDSDVGLILEYQQDFREEAGKCGTCKKVVVFDRHPEGILQIYMTSPEEADGVVTLFNNRFFGGKKITAFNWDGHTKYKIEETDAERDDRLKNWEKFISSEEPGAAAVGSQVPEEDKPTPPGTPPNDIHSDSD